MKGRTIGGVVVVGGLVAAGVAGLVVAHRRRAGSGGGSDGLSLGTGGSGPGWKAASAVQLTEAMGDFLSELASKSGETLYVTSGVRTPEAQARALLTKLDLGETVSDLYALYKADDLVAELADLPRTIDVWTAAIAQQVARGELLSSHLSGYGLDLRVDVDQNGQVSAAEQDRVDRISEAVRQLGGRVVQEGTPPHLHLELRGALA